MPRTSSAASDASRKLVWLVGARHHHAGCSLIQPAKPGGCNSSFLGSDRKNTSYTRGVHNLHVSTAFLMTVVWTGRKLAMQLSASGTIGTHWRNYWRGRRRDAEGEMPVNLIATINDAGATSGLRSCGSCGCWILMLQECTQGTRRQRREDGPLAGGGRF